MKELFKKAVSKGVSSMAVNTAKKEADSTCICFFYQPHVPKTLKNRDFK